MVRGVHAALAPDLDLRLPHPRGGSTAAQELAFTLKDGLTYVEQAVSRGLDVDDFAPRLSFFFNAQIDFFEEIAKYRAARRIWARELRDTFGAKKPESLRMRFHTQTAGVSLTAQQPLNNIVRTAIEALAGVLGGTQSLHTNSFDEALALPTEEAVRIALRTQQIIAYETGVTDTIDPLGGAYFVEALTDRLEQQCYEYFAQDRRARRHGRGGQARLPAARDRRRRVRAAAGGRGRPSAGWSASTPTPRVTTTPTPILRIDPALEGEQIAASRRFEGGADAVPWRERLTARAGRRRPGREPDAAAARGGGAAAESKMVKALQTVFGSYTEAPVF